MSTKTKKILIPFLVLALAGAVAFVVVRTKPEVERRERATLPPLVRVIEVTPQEVALDVPSQGTVQPPTRSTLVAQVGGRIERVSPSFAEGGFFEAGETLVRIDPRDYELAVEQARSQLAQAKVALAREEAEAAVAREEWEELGRGPASPLVLREPQLAQARAAVAAAEAAVTRARLDLARTRVTAPFAGRVETKQADLGQSVNPGTPLATVYSIDHAEVRLPVEQSDLAFLPVDLGWTANGTAAGPAVELTGTIGGTTHRWRGRVVRTASAIDPRTRMLELFARVDDPFRRRTRGVALPMGLFVEAEIEGEAVDGVYVLPRAALRGGEDPHAERDARFDRVFVADSEGRLRFRDVELLRTEGERALVASGLLPGDRVVVSPMETPVEGMEVRTTVEPSPAGGGVEAGSGVSLEELGNRPVGRSPGAQGEGAGPRGDGTAGPEGGSEGGGTGAGGAPGRRP